MRHSLVALCMVGACARAGALAPTESMGRLQLAWLEPVLPDSGSPRGLHPSLTISTVREYAELKPLIKDPRTSGDTFLVHVRGTGQCALPMEGPASTQIPFPLALPRHLVVSAEGRQDRYTLEITASLLIARPSVATFTEFVAPRQWRTPINTVATTR